MAGILPRLPIVTPVADAKTLTISMAFTESDLCHFGDGHAYGMKGGTVFKLTGDSYITSRVLREVINALGYQIVSEDDFTDGNENKGIITKTTYPWDKFKNII